MLSTTPQVDASVLISDTSDMHPHGVAQADWRLDTRLRRLTLGGLPVALGDRAFDLLRVLDLLASLGHREVHLAAKGWGAIPATFAAVLATPTAVPRVSARSSTSDAGVGGSTWC